MLKKLLSVVLAAILCLSLVACGGDDFETASTDFYDDLYSSTTDSSYDYDYDDDYDDLYSSTTDSSYDYDYDDDYDYDYNYNDNTTTTHTHYYTSSVTKEATCGATGVRTYRCSCGNSYTETISKSSYHDWEYATCTKPKTCKDCGKTEGSANGHTYYSSGKCSCGAINPVVQNTLNSCSLELPTLPKYVSYYGYSDKLYSSVKITNITYEFECDNDGDIELTVYFSGEKTYDYRGSGQSDSCKVGWKLYDPNGAVIATGTFYSPSIQVGEKFSNQSDTVLHSWDGGVPGKYRLDIVNVN